ncbi:hypothetical protein PR202_gb13296 [Eleusine coracana subsp. coracana]|uniref:Chalcone synthase n=1 Tax=Eleusine coracana subsp. coracana TaxID=191504 RepID=A0AAV5ESI2_ELECO|nr:hypothetical protein PR202_gb13296 [Eleusine coracana subsp. coracana]
MLATGLPANVIEESWRARRPDGTAAVLAIGTANPATSVRQDEYTDWYFRVTNSKHLSKLIKTKMKRICEKSGLTKRYFLYTDETASSNPGLTDRTLPFLEARMTITMEAVLEFASARPATDITLNSWPAPAVQRTMLNLHSCFGGSSTLHVAKDLAKYNLGARVLVVCNEHVDWKDMRQVWQMDMGMISHWKLESPVPAKEPARSGVVHPGGLVVLDSCDAALLLEPQKLAASRRVLSEYGNMGASTIFFVLDEMRRWRQNYDDEEGGMCGNQWGVMLRIGPGLTIETMLLQAATNPDDN